MSFYYYLIKIIRRVILNNFINELTKMKCNFTKILDKFIKIILDHSDQIKL